MRWTCDWNCGFISTCFDEVAQHEKTCPNGKLPGDLFSAEVPGRGVMLPVAAMNTDKTLSPNSESSVSPFSTPHAIPPTSSGGAATVEMVRSEKGAVGLKIFRNEGLWGGLWGGITFGPCHILEIAPNSPADTSECFRVGDAILAIDGTSVLNLGLHEIMGLFAGPPNSRVSMLMQADPDIHAKVVELGGVPVGPTSPHCTSPIPSCPIQQQHKKIAQPPTSNSIPSHRKSPQPTTSFSSRKEGNKMQENWDTSHKLTQWQREREASEKQVADAREQQTYMHRAKLRSLAWRAHQTYRSFCNPYNAEAAVKEKEEAEVREKQESAQRETKATAVNANNRRVSARFMPPKATLMPSNVPTNDARSNALSASKVFDATGPEGPGGPRMHQRPSSSLNPKFPDCEAYALTPEIVDIDIAVLNDAKNWSTVMTASKDFNGKEPEGPLHALAPHSSMRWTCDWNCGFISTCFDEVAQHEKTCARGRVLLTVPNGKRPGDLFSTEVPGRGVMLPVAGCQAYALRPEIVDIDIVELLEDPFLREQRGGHLEPRRGMVNRWAG
jgi:hypothetical protein